MEREMSGTVTDYANDEAAIEFETFQLPQSYHKGNYGKYTFLKAMPKDAHFHFRENLSSLRKAVSDLNKRFVEQGSQIHFRIQKVGDDDPKGHGLRVLRDDKAFIHRPRKTPEVRP
jgi:hypothetical protein